MAMKVQGGKMVPFNPVLKQEIQHNEQRSIEELTQAYAKLQNTVVFIDRMKSAYGSPSTDITTAENAVWAALKSVEKAVTGVKNMVRKIK